MYRNESVSPKDVLIRCVISGVLITGIDCINQMFGKNYVLFNGEELKYLVTWFCKLREKYNIYGSQCIEQFLHEYVGIEQ